MFAIFKKGKCVSSAKEIHAVTMTNLHETFWAPVGSLRHFRILRLVVIVLFFTKTKSSVVFRPRCKTSSENKNILTRFSNFDFILNSSLTLYIVDSKMEILY